MFNREYAVSYALLWAKNRNPKFYNFDDIGGDCTNFVSQCLFFSGIEMCQNWFYYSLEQRSPSWTSVEDFFSFFKENGAKIHNNLDEVKRGDIIQLRQNNLKFNHSLIVSKIEFGEIYICAHSYDALNKNLKDYYWKELRIISVD